MTVSGESQRVTSDAETLSEQLVPPLPSRARDAQTRTGRALTSKSNSSVRKRCTLCVGIKAHLFRSGRANSSPSLCAVVHVRANAARTRRCCCVVAAVVVAAKEPI